MEVLHDLCYRASRMRCQVAGAAPLRGTDPVRFQEQLEPFLGMKLYLPVSEFTMSHSVCIPIIPTLPPATWVSRATVFKTTACLPPHHNIQLQSHRISSRAAAT